MCVSHGANLYQGQADDHPARIDIHFFKSIVDQYKIIEPQTNKSILPQFQGESLLHPQFLEMCEYMDKVGILFGFTTNASLLTPNISKELLKMKNFHSIKFSLDGLYADTYEHIRVGADYKKVEENILTFLQYRKEYESIKSIIIGISYTEQPANEKETDEFIRKWVELVPSVSINNVAVNGRPEKVFFRPDRFPCGDLWSFMIVLTNGQVVPCCRDYLYEFNLGNLHEQSLAEVWYGKKYQEMRQKHTEGKWDDYPLCADCDTWMTRSTERIIEDMPPDIIITKGPFFRIANKIEINEPVPSPKTGLIKDIIKIIKTVFIH